MNNLLMYVKQNVIHLVLFFMGVWKSQLYWISITTIGSC